ncbi:putative death-receptor fusion protein-domain-containing protein [Sporodiniella umbellata]|nr:putative death-receptor fusion protein-domain-containing protein [Sporodiniella umbellata]
MEKLQKGAKPVKLPKSLFDSWRTIIDEYCQKSPGRKLIAPAVTLQKLASLKDASWDKQAACIKESTKLLQKALSKELSDTDLEQIRDLVEPIVSLGHFAAQENLSRRTFVPLVEVCVSCLNVENETYFNKYYKKYISEKNTEPCFEGKPVSQKALTLYAMAKFNLGQTVIVNNFCTTLEYLTTALQDAREQIKSDTKENKAKQHTSLDHLMTDIEFISKAILALFSRQLEVGPALFQKVESGLKDEAEVLLFGKTIKTLLDICIDTVSYSKECNQVAGMAIGAFVNLANDIFVARDWALGCFFTKQTNATVQDINSTLGISLSCKRFLGEEGWSGRDAPMIFILRGLASSLRKEVTLLDCPQNLCLVGPSEKPGLKNLHEIIFYNIDLFCGTPNLDSSCKVVAFESMATWLQQTKSTIENCQDSKTMDSASGPVNSKNMDRLVHFVWDHWDDPIDSIQHKASTLLSTLFFITHLLLQVRSIFELSLSLMESKSVFYDDNQEYKVFINTLLKNMLTMDWHRKVKYALLNMLVEKVETQAFLNAEPRLIEKCLVAMDSFILCPQITYFLLTFLYRRIQDTIPGQEKFKGHNGKLKYDIESDSRHTIDQWIDLWATPLLKCLTSSSELLRKNVNNFLLQPLFKITPQSFWRMVTLLQDLDDSKWKDGSFNAEFRLNAFIAVLKSGRGLDIVDGNSYTLDPTNEGTKISVDTLKLAIHHNDHQVRIDVLGLLCESRKATAEITAIELDMIRLFLPLNMNSTAPEFRQQMCAHLTKFLMRLRSNIYSQYRQYKSCQSDKDTVVRKDKIPMEKLLASFDQAKSFMYWLCDFITESLYPGASYQRVATTLRILSIVIKLFGVVELPPIEGFTDQQPDFPFQIPVANARLSKLLINVFMNPYDFNRIQAFDILDQFPSPLPGIDSKTEVQDLLWWGLNNVVSTRAGESDSGAMIFRLIFKKYVMDLGFDLNPEQQKSNISKNSYGPTQSTYTAIAFTVKLLDLLETQVDIAKQNLLLAAQHHPMHGTLLALQYVFRELDYNSTVFQENFSDWKKVHLRAIRLIEASCDAGMEVLSDPSPEGNLPSDYRDDENMEEMDLNENADINGDDSLSGPKHQVILSCCWRAVKEASSLLQTVIANAPVSSEESEKAILTHQNLVQAGNLFHNLLTNIRHRGAFSSVYPAYVSLNAKLLASNNQSIAQLPSQWLQKDLNSLTSSNISITRRSAGLPLCILAIVSSEQSLKRELLEGAMKRLLALASEEPPKDADQRIDLPQVHAYNIMRSIFMDSKLGGHVLEYVSKGFSLAISGFSSFSWAIRNCSVMLFSTLLQRTFGTKKTKDEHSHINTLTGREFFVRYPDLHPYLLKELKIAVDQLLSSSSAASVHPGLYPILTLLSRMKPSVEGGDEKETLLTPFIPLVMPCASSTIYKTREMAARALVPLVIEVVPTAKQLLNVSESMSQNEIHGRLVQTQFLLRAHLYSNATQMNTLNEFIKEMPALLLEKLNLFTEKQMCNMNNALFLQIISEFVLDTTWIVGSDRDKSATKKLLDNSCIHFAEIRDVVVPICLKEITSNNIHGIGSYLYRQAIANVILINTLKEPNADTDSLLVLLEDRDYEVRLLTLEKLTKYFETYSHSGCDKTSSRNLHRILLNRTFEGEENQNCYVLVVKLLMKLYPTSPYLSCDNDGMFTIQEYWNKLTSIFNEKKPLSVKESALPLLGSLLEQVHLLNDSEWSQKCFNIWSGYIVKFSQKEITLPLREAVVKSINHASLFLFSKTEKQDDDAYRAKVSAFLSVIQLLQDDDIDVRTDMAEIVSKAMFLQTSVHHERALELVHKYLINAFSESAFLKKNLESVLKNSESLQSIWEKELSHSKALFEKENPNIYKEDLIDIQWAKVDLNILHLEKNSIVDYEQVKSICQQLTAFAKSIRSLSTTYMQQGPYGLTSVPNVFIAVYKTISILHTYITIIGSRPSDTIPSDAAKMLLELLQQLTELDQNWLDPLLWNLLHGNDGLCPEIAFVLKYSKKNQLFKNMFLLAPDMRAVH